MRTNPLFRLPLFFLLFAAALLLSRCSKSDSPTSPGPGDTGSVADTVRPVVFVHGRLGAADTWTWMIQYFRYNGYPRNYLQPMDLQNMYTGSFAQCDIPGMATRVRAVHPLFGLKWCMILLNEFRPENLARRRFANGATHDAGAILDIQLGTARQTLERVTRGQTRFPS